MDPRKLELVADTKSVLFTRIPIIFTQAFTGA